MATCKLGLDFNSAITGLPTENGKFDQQAHQAQILPLRGLIMQIDGVSGVFIARYGVQIDYCDNIVTAKQILTAVQQAIDTLMAIEGTSLFPLRGEKKPTVTIDSSTQPKPTYRKMVIVRLPSDLTAFTKDNEVWQQLEALVGGHLAHHEGVRGYDVYLREVSVTFDTRLTTATAIKRHISRSLGLMHDGVRIFPFLGDRKLRFTKIFVIDVK